jgi:hypothetical protein
VTFGRDEKLRYDLGKVPGPGHYELKPTFADVPKYLLPNSNWEYDVIAIFEKTTPYDRSLYRITKVFGIKISSMYPYYLLYSIGYRTELPFNILYRWNCQN